MKYVPKHIFQQGGSPNPLGDVLSQTGNTLVQVAAMPLTTGVEAGIRYSQMQLQREQMAMADRHWRGNMKMQREQSNKNFMAQFLNFYLQTSSAQGNGNTSSSRGSGGGGYTDIGTPISIGQSKALQAADLRDEEQYSKFMEKVLFHFQNPSAPGTGLIDAMSEYDRAKINNANDPETVAALKQMQISNAQIAEFTDNMENYDPEHFKAQLYNLQKSENVYEPVNLLAKDPVKVMYEKYEEMRKNKLLPYELGSMDVKGPGDLIEVFKVYPDVKQSVLKSLSTDKGVIDNYAVKYAFYDDNNMLGADAPEFDEWFKERLEDDVNDRFALFPEREYVTVRKDGSSSSGDDKPLKAKFKEQGIETPFDPARASSTSGMIQTDVKTNVQKSLEKSQNMLKTPGEIIGGDSPVETATGLIEAMGKGEYLKAVGTVLGTSNPLIAPALKAKQGLSGVLGAMFGNEALDGREVFKAVRDMDPADRQKFDTILKLSDSGFTIDDFMESGDLDVPGNHSMWKQLKKEVNRGLDRLLGSSVIKESLPVMEWSQAQMEGVTKLTDFYSAAGVDPNLPVFSLTDDAMLTSDEAFELQNAIDANSDQRLEIVRAGRVGVNHNLPNRVRALFAEDGAVAPEIADQFATGVYVVANINGEKKEFVFGADKNKLMKERPAIEQNKLRYAAGLLGEVSKPVDMMDMYNLMDGIYDKRTLMQELTRDNPNMSEEQINELTSANITAEGYTDAEGKQGVRYFFRPTLGEASPVEIEMPNSGYGLGQTLTVANEISRQLDPGETAKITFQNAFVGGREGTGMMIEINGEPLGMISEMDPNADLTTQLAGVIEKAGTATNTYNFIDPEGKISSSGGAGMVIEGLPNMQPILNDNYDVDPTFDKVFYKELQKLDAMIGSYGLKYHINSASRGPDEKNHSHYAADLKLDETGEIVDNLMPFFRENVKWTRGNPLRKLNPGDKWREWRIKGTNLTVTPHLNSSGTGYHFHIELIDELRSNKEPI